MRTPLRVATIVGARPQFIKAAPLSRRFAGSGSIAEFVIHTGQHYDEEMSSGFFAELGLPEPSVHLGVGSEAHGAQTGRMLEGIEAALLSRVPDMVIVYGDTNSTLAGALASAKLDLPLVHVEAGLRSFDRSMPEEVNRVVTDHLSTLLLCPSELAVANLAAEGIADGVHLIGDVMRDALDWVAGAGIDEEEVLGRYGVAPGSYVLATLHRPSNVDDPERLAEVMEALDRLSREYAIIFPAHPRTSAALDWAAASPYVAVLKPIGYGDLMMLAKHAAVGVTDSGGLQKELYWFGTPAVTLRATTEWPETVSTGWNRLVTGGAAEIVTAVREATAMDRPRPELYGDGHAAKRIEELMLEWWAKHG